jgi:hypothetical protein
LNETKIEEDVFPANIIQIMRDVINEVPTWVRELPSESYVAEISSRILLHPDTKNFTKGDQRKNYLIEKEFERILMEKIKQTGRYKAGEDITVKEHM